MNLRKRLRSGSRRSFRDSFKLAWRIFKGTIRLLQHHPKLLLPLIPVFVMAYLVTTTIDRILVMSGTVFLLFLGAIFITAYALMFSFAISSRMLKQIHEGQTVSLTAAISAPETVRMIRRVMVLSVIWYSLVLILVIIEMIISGLLDRISDGLGKRVMRAVFGTAADALRMSAFMMVAVMVFEDVGVRAAFKRLREIVRDNAFVALGGLTLTSVTGVLISLMFYGIDELLGGTEAAGDLTVVMVPVVAIGWLLTIYLEQMFVTALYLYSTAPESPLVDILLDDFTGKELPQPELIEQPTV